MANVRPFSSQNCQKSLGDLGVKVQDLHQEVQDFLGSDELVDALCQQHDRWVLPSSIKPQNQCTETEKTREMMKVCFD